MFHNIVNEGERVTFVCDNECVNHKYPRANSVISFLKVKNPLKTPKLVRRDSTCHTVNRFCHQMDDACIIRFSVLGHEIL